MTTAVRIADLPDLGAISGTSSFVGEKAGAGLFSAAALLDYIIAATSGPLADEIADRAAGEAGLATAIAAETEARIAVDAGKASLTSPHLTGVPTAPTAAPGTRSVQLATTAFVFAAVAALAARVAAIEANYVTTD